MECGNTRSMKIIYISSLETVVLYKKEENKCPYLWVYVCVWQQARGFDQMHQLVRLVSLPLGYRQQRRAWEKASLLLHYTFNSANEIHYAGQWEEITFEQWMTSF